MQEMYWDSIYLRSCEHPVSLGQIITLPDNTCVFQGLDEPEGESEPGIGRSGFPVSNLPNSKEGSVHAGLVAGDSSARWMLLSSMLSKWILLKNLPQFQPGGRFNRHPLQPSEDLNPAEMTLKTDGAETPEPVVFVRGKECCFQCAINTALSRRRGRHVGLVL